MQENNVAAVPVSGASVTATGIPSGSGGGGGGGSGGGGGGTSNSSNNNLASTPVSSPSNNSSSSNPPISDIDQAQFEADKRAVYKHPLFSLLALLLEKCEQATQGYIPSSTSSSPNGSSNGTSDGDSFSRDIQAFVQLLEKEKRPLLTNNSELDGLMIKALQVLRIHLLELEKVQELCRDFCTRYIACLRGKMQSENLLRSDYALEHNNNLSNSNSPINSPEQDLSGSAQGYYQNADYLSGTDTNEYSNMQGPPNNRHQVDLHHHQQQPPVPPKPSTNPHCTVTNPKDLLPSIVADPRLPPAVPFSPTAPIFLGSGSLSNGSTGDGGGSDDDEDDFDDVDDEVDFGGGRKQSQSQQQRGILPKRATSVMRAWLFQHLVHPYPTEDEKRAIAAQTNLTLLQVNNWFINARRRILQPMLEHATDSSAQSPPPSSQQQYQPLLPNGEIAAAAPDKRYWSDATQPRLPVGSDDQ